MSIKEYQTNDESAKNEAHEPAVGYNSLLTYADYLKLDLEEMVEIIKGKIFKMSPAPRINHQTINGNIYYRLRQQLQHHACKVFNAPVDVVLPIENKRRLQSNTVVQPDVCVICDSRIIEDTAIFGTPDFVIEIIAGHHIKKDTQIKYRIYEEAGVSEYWIVFAEMRFVEVFILEDGRYQRLDTFSEDDVVPVKTLPGVEISIGDIFEGVAF